VSGPQKVTARSWSACSTGRRVRSPGLSFVSFQHGLHSDRPPLSFFLAFWFLINWHQGGAENLAVRPDTDTLRHKDADTTNIPDLLLGRPREELSLHNHRRLGQDTLAKNLVDTLEQLSNQAEAAPVSKKGDGAGAIGGYRADNLPRWSQ